MFRLEIMKENRGNEENEGAAAPKELEDENGVEDLEAVYVQLVQVEFEEEVNFEVCTYR